MSPQRLNEYLSIVDGIDGPWVVCRCQHRIAPASANYKDYVPSAEWPLNHAGPLVGPHSRGEFVFREFYCPNCVTLLETEVAQQNEPFRWDVQLKLESG